jgi:hypothetical protein
MISLTWHMLQASCPYQPRLFLLALGILSTSVRPLSLMSRCYTRGRASPSTTDGCSPTVQLPLSSSSRHHCRRPAATVVIRHRSRPCGLARMRGTRCPMSWTCMVSRDTIPQSWTSVDATYCVHFVVPKWFNRTTYLLPAPSKHSWMSRLLLSALDLPHTHVALFSSMSNASLVFR